MSHITQKQLKTELRYDSVTGVFTWLAARQGRQIKKPIGTYRSDGYLQVRIFGKIYLLHKLAWLYVYGVLPGEIDHKNRNKADNSIDNLREATRSQNNVNSDMRINNTSGFKGVWLHKETGKWRAMIKFEGKNNSLGLFNTKEEAGAAYIKTRAALYGEFVPCH